MTRAPEDLRNKMRAKYLAPVDEAELVARMLEAGCGISRPEGLSAQQALAIADQKMVVIARQMAKAAMLYWQECIANLQATN